MSGSVPPFLLCAFVADIGTTVTIYTNYSPNEITTRNEVLLDKTAGPQLVHKYPLFCGNRRFLTLLTTARRLSLS